jgi:hypothetical protein
MLPRSKPRNKGQKLNKNTNNEQWPGHYVETTWLPCCDRRVRLNAPYEESIRLHERTCKDCGRLWTFATEVSRRDADSWSFGTMIKLGRPNVPAAQEVLVNPNEDGWLDAHNRQEMQRLANEIKAGRL